MRWQVSRSGACIADLYMDAAPVGGQPLLLLIGPCVGLRFSLAEVGVRKGKVAAKPVGDASETGMLGYHPQPSCDRRSQIGIFGNPAVIGLGAP